MIEYFKTRIDDIVSKSTNNFINFQGDVQSQVKGLHKNYEANLEKLQDKTTRENQALERWADRRQSVHENWMTTHMNFCVWSFGQLGMGVGGQEGVVKYHQAEHHGGFIHASDSFRYSAQSTKQQDQLLADRCA